MDLNKIAKNKISKQMRKKPCTMDLNKTAEGIHTMNE